jgi:hypothetical protein
MTGTTNIPENSVGSVPSRSKGPVGSVSNRSGLPSEAGLSAERTTADARQRFRQFFGDRQPVLLSVIPVTADRATLDQVDAARGGGADGVFLVGDGIGHQKVLRAARLAAERHPGFFIGVNCPDLRPQDVFCRLPQGVGGVWASPASMGHNTSEAPAAVDHARRESDWRGLYFGRMQLSLESTCGENTSFDSAHHGTAPRAFRAPISSAIRYVDVVSIGDLDNCELPSRGVVQQVHQTIRGHPLAIISDLGGAATLATWPQVDCVLAAAGPPAHVTGVSERRVENSDSGARTPRCYKSARLGGQYNQAIRQGNR